jgi:hypothetical protein
MIRTVWISLLALVPLFAEVAPAVAQTAKDPIIGTWELNLGKSNFGGNPAPRSMTRTFDYTKDDLILVTNHQVTADGTRRFMHWYMGVGGKEHPEYIRDTEPKPQWFLATTVVDANTRKVHDRRADNPEIYVDFTFAVSEDRKSMTVTTEGRNSEGEPVKSVAVFDKVF